LLVAAVAIRHPLLMILAHVAAIALLIVGGVPSRRRIE
jgi:hypothetical protein